MKCKFLIIFFMLVGVFGESSADPLDLAPHDRLSLLKSQLTDTLMVLRIRDGILTASKENDKLIASKENDKLISIIDNYVDGALFSNISVIVLKDFFHSQYEDFSAKRLYEKDVKMIQKSFCDYFPKNIDMNAYGQTLSILKTDCLKLEGCKPCY